VKKYCKAYTLGELRRFPGWADSSTPDQQDMSDDAIVYVSDELTVLVSPIGNDKDKRLLTKVTPEWEEFCTKTLEFAIPKDLAFAYGEPEKV
jgi:hypothetical protein